MIGTELSMIGIGIRSLLVLCISFSCLAISFKMWSFALMWIVNSATKVVLFAFVSIRVNVLLADHINTSIPYLWLHSVASLGRLFFGLIIKKECLQNNFHIDLGRWRFLVSVFLFFILALVTKITASVIDNFFYFLCHTILSLECFQWWTSLHSLLPFVNRLHYCYLNWWVPTNIGCCSCSTALTSTS